MKYLILSFFVGRLAFADPCQELFPEPKLSDAELKAYEEATNLKISQAVLQKGGPLAAAIILKDVAPKLPKERRREIEKAYDLNFSCSGAISALSKKSCDSKGVYVSKKCGSFSDGLEARSREECPEKEEDGKTACLATFFAKQSCEDNSLTKHETLLFYATCVGLRAAQQHQECSEEKLKAVFGNLKPSSRAVKFSVLACQTASNIFKSETQPPTQEICVASPSQVVPAAAGLSNDIIEIQNYSPASALSTSLHDLKRAGIKSLKEAQVPALLSMLNDEKMILDWREYAKKNPDKAVRKFAYSNTRGYYKTDDLKDSVVQIEVTDQGFFVNFKSKESKTDPFANKKIARGGSKTVYKGFFLEQSKFSPLTLNAILTFDNGVIPEAVKHEDAIYDTLRKADRNMKQGLSQPPLIVTSGNSQKYVQRLYDRGDLAEMLKEGKIKTVTDLIPHFQQVAIGMANLHKLQIIHGDIREDNILIGDDGKAVLTDFGSSRPIGKSSDSRVLPGHYLGTPGYQAPEVSKGGLATVPMDTYAFGIMMRNSIKKVAPKKVEGQLESLISDCTNLDPSRRPNDEEIQRRLSQVR